MGRVNNIEKNPGMGPVVIDHFQPHNSPIMTRQSQRNQSGCLVKQLGSP